MKFSCYASDLFDISEEAVAVFCSKTAKPEGDVLEKIDLLTDGALTDMYKSGEFDGSAGKLAMLHRVPEMSARRVIVAGLGEASKISPDGYRRAAGSVGKMALAHKIKKIALYYNGPDTAQVTSALVEGLVLGSYRYFDFKTKKEDRDEVIEALAVVVPQKGKLRQAETGLARGEIISRAVVDCRDLVNLPGNELYPETFAAGAEKLAKTGKFRCRVLGPAEIKKEKMGALLAVAQGADHQPRFVILEYNGRGAAAPVVLVGKGVTFDSGGISIKPALDMGEMKGDMTGAAVVLNVIAAAAQLKANVNLVGLLPLVENMPSGRASRPGDIIKARSGLTVEIISTDAEGRLILADALDYAKTLKPQAVIDIATLTGAAQYILGYAGAPFVGTSQKLNDNLRTAAEVTGERIWELPLWDDFAEAMKSKIADLKNSGGRPAGTLTASSFLKQFIGDWPWAHIDIAYCDLEPKGLPYVPVGPTGFGVRLLLELILRWKKVT